MGWSFLAKSSVLSSLAMCLTAPAHAAFVTIDDSHPDLVTITAGDFEGGFFVNGTLLSSCLGSSASITLPGEGYSI